MSILDMLLEDHKLLVKNMENIIIVVIRPFFDCKNIELKKLFELFNKQFSTHHFVEEEIFYPTLLLSPYLRTRILKSYQFHDLIQNTINELRILPIEDNESWGSKFMVLREIILLHLKEEENEIFPVANEILPESEKELLAKKVQERCKEFQ